MERHEEKFTNRANEPEALDEAMEAAIRAQRRRERITIGAWVGATVVALIVIATVLDKSGSAPTARTASYDNGASQAPVAVTASSDGVVHELTPEQGLPLQSIGTPEGGLSAPPDVVAAVSDSFVTAGQAVEVTVEATPDVTEMALADGIGDAIPMVRDSSGLVWRVNYRVPLRPRTDRLGLSVTAKNEEHRFRRVWLFLEIGDGKTREESGSLGPVEGERMP